MYQMKPSCTSSMKNTICLRVDLVDLVNVSGGFVVEEHIKSHDSIEQREDRLKTILSELIYDFVTDRLPLSKRNSAEELLNGKEGWSL